MMTDQQRAELKALAKIGWLLSAENTLSLLADLEEAETEQRKAQSSANEAWDQLRDAETELAAARQQLAGAQALLASSGEQIEINPPDYHYEAMGCGLEDRGITDRYEAMQYGWDCAIDKFLGQTPEGTLYTAPPVAVIEQAVAPYKKLRDDMEAIAAGSPTIPFREFAMHALHDIDAALSAKEKSNG